ncbi:kinase-like domain-containing protein [Dimargaris cristalligena]|uniref:non-specific serine/threonine protein kinase n=1 Tax=Dimargaris cristalligena TaxID=215637 RepID=A0A4Q0A1S3_9FUNG|nr:kinase-like domain-containing protein [Dimargaris cristalligena]|eukprot:RKP39997.1 kinase-like domain-containing protein [Dimargaris cristalligena]
MGRTAVAQCFPSSPEVLQINGHTYKVLTRLGEGGFSMVYLVRDITSMEEFAVKKIRCAAGTDGYYLAMREVDMYRRFRHSGIINSTSAPAVDQTVYMFLPYYRRGNLQDWIQTERLEGAAMAEPALLRLFRQICEAVQAMHEYHAEGELPALSQSHTNTSGGGSATSSSTVSPPLSSGDGEAGDSSAVESYKRASDGLLITPYAHRDIKPANIMLRDDGITPVLMDLGSSRKARVYIANRQMALQEQDDAAEHCSMPYRAPELFDVPTDTTLDEKVDIWSLGALLYALAYGPSPFESQMNEQGGSIALAVMNGKYTIPASDPYSPVVSKLIKSMLVTDPAQRPNIRDILPILDRAI